MAEALTSVSGSIALVCTLNGLSGSMVLILKVEPQSEEKAGGDEKVQDKVTEEAEKPKVCCIYVVAYMIS